MLVNILTCALLLMFVERSACQGPGASNSDWLNTVGRPLSSPVVDESQIHQLYSDSVAFISYLDETHNVYKNRTAEGVFGEGIIGPITGYVFHVRAEKDKDDHRGCTVPLWTSGPEPVPLPINNAPWVALIQRGECNFEQKVRNAFVAKAVGVIIYDDRVQGRLDRMKLPAGRTRNISSIFTYKWQGEEIAHLVDNGSRIWVNVSVGSSMKLFPNINRTSVLFVSISFIILMIISLIWLIFYYVQRFRYIHAKERLSKRLCVAAKKALSKIPTRNIKAEDKEMEGEGECCAVCIEPYKLYDIIRILPCRHEYHKGCIDPWLLEHRTCPMCKMDILKYYGFVFTGSQESILQIDLDEPFNAVNSTRSTSSQTGNYTAVNERRSPSSSNDFDSINSNSRPPTPTELTPSLEETRRDACHKTMTNDTTTTFILSNAVPVMSNSSSTQSSQLESQLCACCKAHINVSQRCEHAGQLPVSVNASVSSESANDDTSTTTTTITSLNNSQRVSECENVRHTSCDVVVTNTCDTDDNNAKNFRSLSS